MEWTREKPAIAGYYWAVYEKPIDYPWDEPVLIEVENLSFGQRAYLMGDECWWEVDWDFYCGPLQPPALPKGA